jgi:hypothetical protein
MKNLTTLTVFFFLFTQIFAQHDSLRGTVHNSGPKLFIGGGIAVNSLKVTGSKTYHEILIDHKPTVSPLFLVGAKFYNKQNRGNFLVMPSVSLYSIDIKGDIQLTSGLAKYSHESTFQSKLVINPAGNIGYRLVNRPLLQWHVSVGLGFLFLIDANETQTTKYSSGDQTRIERKPDPMVFVFNGETGIKIGKHAGAWLRFQPFANTTEYSTKFMKIASVQAGLSWVFKSDD